MTNTDKLPSFLLKEPHYIDTIFEISLANLNKDFSQKEISELYNEASVLKNDKVF